ncbi:hypothetical protein FQA39_LY02653 [Lamprigera yunnana]|nr:hypothetical protein FQA39_LY02653 [Lamprigera yunnana]
MEIKDSTQKFTDDVEDEEQNERESIRNKISTLSFEDLQKLKEEIGSKEYNQMVFGAKKNTKKQTKFKRENKNRPRERSSKIRFENAAGSSKVVARDPRFDPLCGTYKESTFRSNYKFIGEIKKEERAQLEKEYKKERDTERKQKIKLLMQRMDNQSREYEKRAKQKTTEEKERKDISDQLKQGKKPTFKKKSEKRIEDLVNKYEELKKSNRLEKYFEKRYKKFAKKDKT